MRVREHDITITILIKSTMNIFIAYSKEDRKIVTDLRKHLKILKRVNLVQQIWYDGVIGPEVDWEKAINNALVEVDLMLLLLSSDFIDSDYCYEKGIEKAIELHSEDKLTVIPILCRDCLWEDTPFSKIQVLPRDGKSIASYSNRDKVLAEIVKEIKNVAITFKTKDKRRGVVPQFEPYEVVIKLNVNNQVIPETFIINQEDSCDDVFDEIYFLIEDQVSSFSYLEEWVLVEEKRGKRLIVKDIQDLIPANIVFNKEYQWEVKYIDKPLINE